MVVVKVAVVVAMMVAAIVVDEDHCSFLFDMVKISCIFVALPIYSDKVTHLQQT